MTSVLANLFQESPAPTRETAPLLRNLTLNEITGLQGKVLAIIDEVYTNKGRIETSAYKELNNHLQYVMTVLRNMATTQVVEKSDPYNSFQSDYTGVTGYTGSKVLYNADGTTRLTRQPPTTGQGWELQFDESQLMNPPCFMVPPQNLTSIPAIRRADRWRRVNNL
jgi:hypothetical protein